MEIWNALFDVLVLLVGALILGTLFERVRQSAVVGFIIAGACVGPHGLDIVASSEEVAVLAELGVSLLLFSIGLEFSRSKLARLRKASVLGVLQVVSTATVGWLLALALGLEGKEAVGIGLVICLSSTACVLRVLADRSQMDSGTGRNSLGVLLVQDIAVIPLAFAMEFMALGGEGAAAGGPSPFTIVFGALGFGTALWAVLKFVAPWFLGSRVLTGNRELSLLLAVVAGLGAASGAHAVGVSPALGAFIAGIVLAGSPFAVQVRSDVGALKTLLLTLFFGSVGMLADPAWIAAHFFEVIGLLTALILTKAILVTVIVRGVSGRWQFGVASGLALAQIGEFSFLLAELGRGTVVSAATEPYLVSVILLSLLLTPYLVMFGGPLERWIFRRQVIEEEPPVGKAGAAVLLVGFGPSGKRAAKEISTTGKMIRVIDLNSQSVLTARKAGYLGTVGDAAHAEVLEHIGVESLELVVIALPDPNAVVEVLSTVTALRPGLPIVVRARYHMHRGRFERFPEARVVDEEYEVGVSLGQLAAECLGERCVDDRDLPEPPGVEQGSAIDDREPSPPPTEVPSS